MNWRFEKVSPIAWLNIAEFLAISLELEFMGLRRTRTAADSRSRRELLQRKPSMESMEGRILLSQGAAAHPMIAARHELTVERINQYKERTKAYNAEHSTDLASVTGGIDFTKDTVNTGKKLAISGNVLDVGGKFIRQSFSKNTTKVGWEYLKAAVQGNGKEIHALGKTDLVRKVGMDFTALGRNSVVKKVGHTFSVFGHAVESTFHKVF